MPGIKPTLKQVFQPVLIPPSLPIGKEPPSFLAWSLPLSLTGFVPADIHTPVLCMGSWVAFRGILQELAEISRIQWHISCKTTEEALLSWLGRKVSFLAKVKSS